MWEGRLFVASTSFFDFVPTFRKSEDDLDDFGLCIV